MIKILSSVTETIREGVNYIRADIAVDSASDLTVEFASFHFTMGSIAWDISTGDFYGLDSTGTWTKQGESS